MSIDTTWNRRFRVLLGAATAAWILIIAVMVIRALLADHAAYSANPKQPVNFNFVLFGAVRTTILPYLLVMVGATVGYFVTRN